MQVLASSQCSFHRGTCLQRARAQPVRQAAAQQCTVAKAKTKASDFRRLTNEQIDEEVIDAQVSLYLDFRYAQAQKSGVSLAVCRPSADKYIDLGQQHTVCVLADQAETPVEVGS